MNCFIHPLHTRFLQKNINNSHHLESLFLLHYLLNYVDAVLWVTLESFFVGIALQPYCTGENSSSLRFMEPVAGQ